MCLFSSLVFCLWWFKKLGNPNQYFSHPLNRNRKLDYDSIDEKLNPENILCDQRDVNQNVKSRIMYIKNSQGTPDPPGCHKRAWIFKQATASCPNGTTDAGTPGSHLAVGKS